MSRTSGPMGIMAAIMLLGALVGCAAPADSPVPGAVESVENPSGDPAERAPIEATMSTAMEQNRLRALVVRVTRDGQEVYTGAMGESMTGVPATPDMQFRAGSMAFTYIAQTFAKLVDAGSVSLEDPLARWLPEVPKADKVTLRNLLNMTSGYADYVRQPALLRGLDRDPFRQWTNAELLDIGLSAPMVFEPGQNWAYSHTNYVLLGEVLEKVTGKPLAEVMEQYVIAPMGLTQTTGNGDTPAILGPVLHTYSSERREALGIADSIPFVEDSTFWNPSWTTARGAVQTTTITDMTRSMEIIGSGEQVSPEMYAEQVDANLVGFGDPDPQGGCPLCRRNTRAQSYGLGVILLGDWITQTKSFAGSAATTGYLPSEKLAISAELTFLPAAYRSPEIVQFASVDTFEALVATLSPQSTPPPPPPGR